MLLYTYNWGEIGMWILIVLVIATVAILLYRRLLTKLNASNMNSADYCILYSLENEVASGEVEIYFTTERKREAKIILMDTELNEISVIKEGIFSSGGNIIKMDTTKFQDGNYYYALITDNQKTTKKFRIQNS